MKRVVWLMFIIASGCDRSDRKLIIENKSSEAVIAEYSFDRTFDSSINEYVVDLGPSRHGRGNNHLFKIEPNTSLPLYGAFNTTWEDIIERSYSKKLNLFVFQWDSLVKYRDLHRLYKARGCYKKFEFTKEQLEGMGWKVTIR